jgi:preprotein translocase subunit SecF
MNNNNKESFGKFDFVGKAGFFGGLSVVFVLVSLVYLLSNGINYGIDFAGGTEVQVKFQQSVSIDEVRKLADEQGFRGASVQAFDNNEFIVRFQTIEGNTEKETNENQTMGVDKLRASITSTLGAANPEIRRVDSVGPQVGAELKRSGVLSMFYAMLVILIYIALRFDFKYSPGAVICLAHDAIIALAIFQLSGREVNVPILAAILTLLGYSLNDTIVVFDRIRETEDEYSSKGWKFIINKSINDMLSRTIITNGSMLACSAALYLIAGGVISDIAFALTVGIFFGTYSSIYVAAPCIILVEKLRLMRKAA